MSDDDNQDSQRALRERIVSLMRANDQAHKKPVTDEERQKLQTAASRLDHLLNSSANADRQALATAAARLDQLLADIRQGKDVPLKRRPPRQNKT